MIKQILAHLKDKGDSGERVSSRQNQGLSCTVLKTSRFFPEEDSKQARLEFNAANLEVNELLICGIDIADNVQAHLLAIDCFVISATKQGYRSDLTLTIGRKGYHDTTFSDGPYLLDERI